MESRVEKLRQLGFSQYEAQAYLTLLQEEPLNGYELAKASGIPRANIYGVLQKLEERGAVNRLDTPGGTRYLPTSGEELIYHLEKEYRHNLDEAQASLENLTAPSEYTPVWNAQGYPVLIQHTQALIDSARENIVLALGPHEAEVLSASLLEAQERGVNITTLCLAGCPHPCSHCQGQVYRSQVVVPSGCRWLVVIVDRQEMLAGEIQDESQAHLVRTRQKLLVNLADWYVRNSVGLAGLIQGLGSHLEENLSPEQRAVLAPPPPDTELGGWLKSLDRLSVQPGSGSDRVRSAQ